jgi:hypothetical protein
MAQFSKYVVELKTLPNQDMLALAYAAYRINGYRYVKEGRRFSEGQPTQHANKDLVRFFLHQKGHASGVYVPNDYVPFSVTEEDYASVERARNHFKRYTMDVLGDSLSTFQKSVYEVYCQEQIAVNAAGLVSYLPELVERELEEIAFKKLLRTEYRDSVHVGAVGDSVEGVAKILRGFYSKQWERWYYTVAIDGNVFSLSNCYEHSVGTMIRLKARVKGHTKNRVFAVDETQLNYVKLYKV